MSPQRSTFAVFGRATRQRAAVERILDTVDGFRSAQDIYDQLCRHGEEVGLTTVYRTLQSLADAGEIDRLRTDSGEATYRRCSPQHHHHLICRHCRRTLEIHDTAIEHWAEHVGTQHGFSEIGHTVEIFGCCAECTH